MNAITLLIICLSVWASFQLLAVLVGWRFTSIRPRFDAVLQVRDEAIAEWQKSGTEQLDRWAAHCDDADLITHEADYDLSEDNEEYADDFLAWTNEIRERSQ